MGLLKDVGILAIIIVLIILGLGAAHVTAVSLNGYWNNFWQNYHPQMPSNLPFGL